MERTHRISHHRRQNMRGNRRGGSGRAATVAAPTNSVAPVASGTVTIGGTLTTTDGTWTGSPTFTYQWRRAGNNIIGATASSYTPVAADIDDTVAIDCMVTATNAGGSASADSNNLSFAPDTIFPNSAIGVSTSGITPADSNTTVDQWAAAYGGKKTEVVLAAPAATNRPAYNATGGPGSRPRVEFDGVDNTLRDTAITFGGNWGGMDLTVIGHLASLESNGDIVFMYGGGGTLCTDGSTHLRGFVGTNSFGTTVFTGTPRQGSYDWIAGGNQRILVNEVAEDTDANADIARTDGLGVSLGATGTGTQPTTLVCLGWAISRGAAGAALSASQRADLRAFFTNKCGNT